MNTNGPIPENILELLTGEQGASDLTHGDALKLLQIEREAEEQIITLRHKKERCRELLQRYVLENGSFSTEEWKVHFLSESVSISYDKAELEKIAKDNSDFAVLLAAARKEMQKVGYLRIERAR